MSELWTQWPTSINYSVCLSLSLFSQTNPPPPLPDHPRCLNCRLRSIMYFFLVKSHKPPSNTIARSMLTLKNLNTIGTGVCCCPVCISGYLFADTLTSLINSPGARKLRKYWRQPPLYCDTSQMLSICSPRNIWMPDEWPVLSPYPFVKPDVAGQRRIGFRPRRWIFLSNHLLLCTFYTVQFLSRQSVSNLVGGWGTIVIIAGERISAMLYSRCQFCCCLEWAPRSSSFFMDKFYSVQWLLLPIFPTKCERTAMIVLEYTGLFDKIVEMTQVHISKGKDKVLLYVHVYKNVKKVFFNFCF